MPQTQKEPQVKANPEIVRFLKDVSIFSQELMSFSQELNKEASRSADLASMSVIDSIAQEVKEFLGNPLQASVKALAEMEKAIILQVKAVVNATFTKKLKNLYIKVYEKSDNPYSLEYIVLLKNYNLESRAAFNNFLSWYGRMGLRNRIPMLFHYLPPDFDVKKLKGVKELSFNDTTGSSGASIS